MESDVAATGQVLSQSYLNVDLNDVTLQRHVANLQLLDVITGQLDRHMGNVKIQQAVGGAAGPSAVTGIDNDFALSSFVPAQAPPVGQPPDTIPQGSKTISPGWSTRYMRRPSLRSGLRRSRPLSSASPLPRRGWPCSGSPGFSRNCSSGSRTRS